MKKVVVVATDSVSKVVINGPWEVVPDEGKEGSGEREAFAKISAAIGRSVLRAAEFSNNVSVLPEKEGRELYGQLKGIYNP